MKYNTIKVLCITLLAGLVAIGCMKKPLDLKLNLEKGKTYSYVMSTIQKTEQEMMGQKNNMDQSMVFGYSMEVKEVDKDHNHTILVKYDRIKMEQKSENLNVLFDSQLPETADTGMAAMLAKPFRALLGNGYTMVMKPDGTVNSITGIEGMIDAIISRMTAGTQMPEENIAQMREQMSMQFNEEMLKNNMEQGFRFYPSKPIKKGDTWNITYTMKGGLPMIINTTYKLTKVSGKTAYVDVDATINIDSTQQMMGKVTMDGKQTGKLEINIPSGLTTHAELKQDINMKMSAMGMEMPAKMSSTIVIEGKKK